MAQVQAHANKPLLPAQTNLLRTHLVALYSGQNPPSQEELTNHLASLLRGFSGQAPPPLPRPQPYFRPPAPAMPAALPAAMPQALLNRPAAPGAVNPAIAQLLANVMRPAPR